MLLSPIFLALGRGRDERPQRQRPVRRGGRSRRSSTTSRSSAAPCSSVPAVRGRGARRRRRRSARSATCSSRSGRWRGSASATTPRIEPARPAGAQGAHPDGAAGDRARRDADHVHRRDRARDACSAIGAVSDFNFAFALLQIPLGIIGVPLGIVVLPVAVARRRGRPRGVVRQPAHPGAAAARST